MIFNLNVKGCFWPLAYRLLLIMKLVILLIVLNMSAVLAESFAQNITLKAKNISLVQAMKSIQKQSKHAFFLNGKDLANIKLDANFENLTLDKAMQQLLKGIPVQWLMEDETIIIKPSAFKKPQYQPEQLKKTMEIRNQKRLVKGKVLDQDGKIIAGASVVISGSTRGAITDLDGSFTIEALSTDKLIISYIGMINEQVVVGSQKELTIRMRGQSSQLEEVAVVAFGTQKKESVIGAISTVDVGDLKMPVGKISNSLAGQMAGIVAVQRSGEPGQSSEFWIRGLSTFGANTTPLVLVDGIERSLDLVDTEDVQSLSILKDATATALYGVRGANGVILVTTKRGKEGKTVINAKLETAMLSPTQMPKMANAEQFMNVYNRVYSEAYNGLQYFTDEQMAKYLSREDPDLYPNVDWMKEIYKDVSTSSRANLSIAGGGKKVRYYAAGSGYRENGIFNAQVGDQYNPSMNYTRYNFRSNVDIDLTSSTVVSLNLSTQYEDKRKPDTDGLWQATFQILPIATPLMYSDGTIASPAANVKNPYNLLNKTGYVQLFSNNAQSLIGITQDFSGFVTPGLKANLKFSWDAVHGATLSRYKNPSTYRATGRDDEGNLEFAKNNDGNDYLTLWKGNSGSRTIYLEGSTTYDRVFNDVHRVGGLFLYYHRDRADEFPSNYVFSLPYRSQGVAGRLTYSYKDVYFAEGNFGYNGSENFAPGHKFGFFPSGAIGYLISNENYFKSVLPVVSLLKLKASYGKVGNDKIGERGTRRFAFNSEMQDATGYAFGDKGQKSLGGISTGYPGNPFVEWERATKLNVGVELGLFNRLKIQADYFYEQRRGIFILRESVPSLAGIAVNPYVNLGEMDNEGIDGSLEFNKKLGEFTLGIRANVTYNRNRKLYDDRAEPTMKYQSTIGKPYNQQFGLVALGYFEDEYDITNSPRQDYGAVRPGDRKYLDINGDGVVNDYDKIAIGRTHIPELNYGFGISTAWRKLDLSLFFQGVGNVTSFMDGPAINGLENDVFFMSNMYEDLAVNSWTVENPDPNAKYPRLSITRNENNKQLSTARQFNAGFMRLKHAELGYTLPEALAKKMHMSFCRIYAQGLNLLTFSKHKLWDPEINQSEGSVYPNMRIINIGLNFQF